jgi:transcription-repair coupling factor (superfamily II helicase)
MVLGDIWGLKTINTNDWPQEFLALEYADKAKLYVPVSSLNLINRYSGVEEIQAPLHKLGGEQWIKSKDKALETDI